MREAIWRGVESGLLEYTPVGAFTGLLLHWSTSHTTFMDTLHPLKPLLYAPEYSDCFQID
jgi:hypothetical protein